MWWQGGRAAGWRPDRPGGPGAWGAEGSGHVQRDAEVYYRLCPRCGRAVPARSGERYCVNDGWRLLDGCPACGARILSPYSRFCAGCGGRLGRGIGLNIE